MGVNVLVLKPGETVFIPSNVDIQSIVADEGGVVQSDCTDLPDQDEYVCYRFDFAESDADNNPAALEDGSIVSIEIADTVYPLNISFGSSIFNIRDIINLNLGPIFIVYSGAKDSSYDERSEYSLGVKIPSLLVPSVKFKIQGTGFTYGALVIPNEITDCACVTTTSGGDSTENFCNVV